MAKIPCNHTDYLTETFAALAHPGALLVTQGHDGKPNAMTIGWSTVGIVWGKPILTVLVRHSRYTWSRLQENGDFTVNILPASRADAATLCGSKSGRDLDKLAAAGLTPVPARHATVPILDECVIHYECRTLHRTNVDPTHLAQEVLDGCYARGDFHTIYHGLILATSVDERSRETLEQ